MFDIEQMFVALIMLSFLGYLFSLLLDLIEGWVLPLETTRITRGMKIMIYDTERISIDNINKVFHTNTSQVTPSKIFHCPLVTGNFSALSVRVVVAKPLCYAF